MSDYTILLIDYDPKSIERIRRVLTGGGYGVEVAKNGIAGLDAFRRSPPALVLVEAMLPKKHGFEVCQEIKQSEAGGEIPVIIITAVYRGRKYRSQAFHLYKCDEYLEKPIADAKLLETVRKFLGDRPPAESAKPADAPTPPAVEPSPPKVKAEEPEPAVAAEPPPPKPEAKESEPVIAAEPPAPPPKPAAAEDRGAARAHDGNGEAKPPAPRHDDDDPVAEFTEEDIMSTLDAIMPDENAPTPSRPR